MGSIFQTMRTNLQVVVDNKLLILVVAICVYSIVSGLIESVQKFNALGHRHGLSAIEKEVDRFKNSLPKKGVVTYVTDYNYDLRSLNFLQYALSPLILLHGKGQQQIIRSLNGPSGYMQFCEQYPRPEYIIGYFNTKSGPNDFCESNSVEIIGEINNRIMLFKR